MTPRSREEASRVRNIIRFFKQGMAPKKGISSSTGGASYFLGTPNVFDIKFKTTRDKYDILNEMMLWLELRLVPALALRLTTHQMECGMLMKKDNQCL